MGWGVGDREGMGFGGLEGGVGRGWVGWCAERGREDRSKGLLLVFKVFVKLI